MTVRICSSGITEILSLFCKQITNVKTFSRRLKNSPEFQKMNRWIKDSKGWKQSLLPGEVLLAQQEGVRLDDGDNKTSFSNGDLHLSSHRMIWSGKGNEIILSLSLVVFAEEEGSGGGFMKSEKILLHLSAPPPSKQSNITLMKKLYISFFSFQTRSCWSKRRSL